MKKLLNTPLLPQNKVKVAVVSCVEHEIISSLRENFSIDVIPAPENELLEPSISTHADCALVQLNKNTVLVNKDCYKHFVNYFTNSAGEFSKELKVIASAKQIKSPYPSDIPLNVKLIGDKLICNTRYIDPSVEDFAHRSSIKLIHTNQGYAACSCITLNEHALITDDKSVYDATVFNGIDTLLISKGSVKLKGHNYGFIGGTCGMIDKNVLAFTGKLSAHTDADAIVSFLNKYGVSYVELTQNPLLDIGGIIPLFEEI